MTNEINEIWLALPGFEGAYEISNMGRVRSLDRFIIDNGLTRKRFRKGRVLKPGRNTNGYLHIFATYKNKQKAIQVHQGVMQTFVGPQEKGIEVMHNNGIKSDNKLSNLSYGTRKDNVKDSFRLNEYLMGEAAPWSKLANEDVINICKDPRFISEISKSYNVSTGTISMIKNRKMWKSLTKDIEIVHKGIFCKSRFSREEWLAHFKSGKTYRQVAKEFNIVPSIVWAIFKKFKAKGITIE